MGRYNPKQISYAEMGVILLIAIVMAEAVTLLFYRFNQDLTPGWGALLHAGTTLLLLFPTYLLLFRPFVNDRHRAEAQIRHLSRRLLSTVEEERTRLAQDLHDECGQTIAALQLNLETLRRTLPESCREKAEGFGEMEDLLSRLGNQIRSVSSTLHPEVLDEMGLVSALKWEIREFRSRFPDIRVEERYVWPENVAGRLGKDFEIALFRICQEGLTNVAKHSGAGHVTLHLGFRKRSIKLLILDDGQGFELESLANRATSELGIGIIGMRERVAGLGGSFILVSQPDRGTAIKVSIPLKPEEGKVV